MPFFQNARHFIINGADGQAGHQETPLSAQEIERKVASALQAVNRGATQSVVMNGQPALTGTNSQYVSVTSGSSSFSGHMGRMSAEDRGYLESELAKMRKQLQDMDERKAKKRANGGRRKEGLDKTSIGQNTSSRLGVSPQVIPTNTVDPLADMGLPPINALPLPDMSGFEMPYNPLQNHTINHFPPIGALPNPDDLDEGLPYPQLGQYSLPPTFISPPTDFYAGIAIPQNLSAPVPNLSDPFPGAQEERGQEETAHPTLLPEVSDVLSEPQTLSPPPKQKSRLSPRRFLPSLPK